MKTLSYLKICILFTITLLISQSGFAQPEVYLGGRAGINIGSFRWDEATRDEDDINTGSIIGPHVGFVTTVEFNDWFGVQGELQYLQKGAKRSQGCENCQIQTAQGTITASEFDQEERYKTNFIEIPLMARLNLGGDNFAFNGFLGPSFGFALSGTQQFSFDLERTNGQGDESNTDTEKLDYDKDLSRFDISALAGVGFSVGAGPGKITFDLRYILGISDVTKEDDIDDRIKNRAFQIGAGYIVRL